LGVHTRGVSESPIAPANAYDFPGESLGNLWKQSSGTMSAADSVSFSLFLSFFLLSSHVATRALAPRIEESAGDPQSRDTTRYRRAETSI